MIQSVGGERKTKKNLCEVLIKVKSGNSLTSQIKTLAREISIKKISQSVLRTISGNEYFTSVVYFAVCIERDGGD